MKQLQKERSPTPIVRPEWVVDCLQAGRLLPVRMATSALHFVYHDACCNHIGSACNLTPASHSPSSHCATSSFHCAPQQIQDYALYQLRDAPGQQKLRAFQQARAGRGLPICGAGRCVLAAIKQERAVSSTAALLPHLTQVRPTALLPEAIYPDNLNATAATAAGPPAVPVAAGRPESGPAAAVEGRQGSGSFSFPAPPPLPPQQQQQAGPAVQAEQQPVRGHEQPPAGRAQQGYASIAGSHAQASHAATAVQGPPGVALGSPSAGAAVAATAGRTCAHSPLAAAVGPRQEEGDAAAGRRSPLGYSASELREAQQLASRLRAECDMLK